MLLSTASLEKEGPDPSQSLLPSSPRKQLLRLVIREIRKGKRLGHSTVPESLPADRQMAPSITGRGWVAKVDVGPLVSSTFGGVSSPRVQED